MALAELGLVARPFHLPVAEPAGLGRASLELRLDVKRDLEGERAHSLDEQLADGPVDVAADDPLG